MNIKLKSLIALMALVLTSACDLSGKHDPKSVACASSLLVGAKSSDVTKVTATASCRIVFEDLDGGCKTEGTFSDLTPGETKGKMWVTDEKETGCSEPGVEHKLPDSYELGYEVKGDKISFWLN